MYKPILRYLCICLWWAGCTPKMDYPQHLAGADTIEIIFADEVGKDTILVKNKTYIKQIAHSLASPPHKAKVILGDVEKRQASIKFLRQNINYNLLEGSIYQNTSSKQAYFYFKNKYNPSFLDKFNIDTKIQTLLTQARKYPTLLKK